MASRAICVSAYVQLCMCACGDVRVCVRCVKDLGKCHGLSGRACACCACARTGLTPRIYRLVATIRQARPELLPGVAGSSPIPERMPDKFLEHNKKKTPSV